ncbi:hypothetical protein AHMF7605_22435 [Adhaeribacter arboris]|uniref:Uncharacterized protein n=1 Tax=Adhaeribacter arboris TaxID=2072846 RepID=A0A2T2YKP5_9BACT|nr:hypothetical protein [Adhaeribacter arboris]PSR56059.1 hypothetical protein AHMF7605_22435 [Adhaeribacter arboris]
MPVLQTSFIGLYSILGLIIALTVLNVYLFISQKRTDAKLQAHKAFVLQKLEELEKLKEELEVRHKANNEYKSEIESPILNTIYRFCPSDN